MAAFGYNGSMATCKSLCISDWGMPCMSSSSSDSSGSDEHVSESDSDDEVHGELVSDDSDIDPVSSNDELSLSISKLSWWTGIKGSVSIGVGKSGSPWNADIKGIVLTSTSVAERGGGDEVISDCLESVDGLG